MITKTHKGRFGLYKYISENSEGMDLNESLKQPLFCFKMVDGTAHNCRTLKIFLMTVNKELKMKFNHSSSIIRGQTYLTTEVEPKKKAEKVVEAPVKAPELKTVVIDTNTKGTEKAPEKASKTPSKTK